MTLHGNPTSRGIEPPHLPFEHMNVAVLCFVIPLSLDKTKTSLDPVESDRAS